jgi:hypothetical protein
VTAPRDLCDIAADVWRDWGERVNYAARPYLEAMDTLRSINSAYYLDSSASIVSYFLCNATTWRGPVARSVKAELNALLRETRA